MKRSDCFKVIKDFKVSRGCKVIRALLGVSVIILLASCTKKDEYDFSGTIVDARECNLMQLPGYIVALEKPTDIGKEYSLGSTQYPHAIILFDPGCQLKKGDHISGSFYLDDKYSRANCQIHDRDLDLPEGVFTSVSVD